MMMARPPCLPAGTNHENYQALSSPLTGEDEGEGGYCMFPPSPPALSPAFAEAASRRQAPGETGITELITYPSGRVITYTPDQIA